MNSETQRISNSQHLIRDLYEFAKKALEFDQDATIVIKKDVKKKFEVPVFNIYTFIEWFQSGLLPARFNPDHDDPRK